MGLLGQIVHTAPVSLLHRFMPWLVIACMAILSTAAFLHWLRARHWSPLALAIGAILVALAGLSTLIVINLPQVAGMLGVQVFSILAQDRRVVVRVRRHHWDSGRHGCHRLGEQPAPTVKVKSARGRSTGGTSGRFHRAASRAVGFRNAWSISFWALEFVSDFELRVSDFPPPPSTLSNFPHFPRT